MGTYKANELGKMLADLKKQTERAMTDDVARSVYEIIQKYILTDLYNSYSPKTYNRTFELLRSLKVSPVTNIGGTISIKIYIPSEELSSEAHAMWYDVPEMGLTKGENPTASQIINILEDNLNKYRSGTNIKEDTLNELKATNIILKKLMNYLRSRGYKIV